MRVGQRDREAGGEFLRQIVGLGVRTFADGSQQHKHKKLNLFRVHSPPLAAPGSLVGAGGNPAACSGVVHLQFFMADAMQ
jgi:hypothetical protein